MPDTDRHGTHGDHQAVDDRQTVETDGGVAAREESVEYLDAEVNIFRPSTPFMRDHLRVVWTGFVAWAIIVFGPVTLTAIAPDVMTTQIPVLGFPLHYFLVGIGAPGGALLLAIWYARKRDQLDEEYGIDHATATGGPGDGEAAATDGGRPDGDGPDEDRHRRTSASESSEGGSTE